MHASVIIPTFNHAATVGAAVTCALSQEYQTEVVVVDDGSTDATADELATFASYVKIVRMAKNSGPAVARNAGLEVATGAFIQFLDADDVIAPDKIAKQVDALNATPRAGWSYCDVRIRRQRGEVLASQAYGYATRQRLDGCLFHDVNAANFIPIHAPVIRRGAIDECGAFCAAAAREDWDFLTRLSAVAEAVYVPEVLATYIKRPGGRNDRPVGDRERVLKLNLGCGNPLWRSWHPLPGFVNLDRHTTDWTWERGLTDFADGSVEAITVSHSLFMVEEQHWPAIMADMRRVLRPNGVLRITEDDAVDPRSSRRGGWRGTEPFKTITCAKQTLRHLHAAGFKAKEMRPDETLWVDDSLIQQFHGAPPDVFHVEAIKV